MEVIFLPNTGCLIPILKTREAIELLEKITANTNLTVFTKKKIIANYELEKLDRNVFSSIAGLIHCHSEFISNLAGGTIHFLVR